MSFNRAGKPAGYLRKNGHMYVTIDGVEYRMDRIIWKMMTGEDQDEIEHINGDKTDMR